MVILIEDRNFYEYYGFDIKGIVCVVVWMVLFGGILGGGGSMII